MDSKRGRGTRSATQTCVCHCLLKSSVFSRPGPGAVGDFPCGGGGGYESTNSGATKSVPFLKNERTNSVRSPVIAREKQWALAMPNVYRHKSLKTPNKLRTKISHSRRPGRKSGQGLVKGGGGVQGGEGGTHPHPHTHTHTHTQYANYWAALTRKRHIPPHSAQPRHTASRGGRGAPTHTLTHTHTRGASRGGRGASTHTPPQCRQVVKRSAAGGVHKGW